MTLSSNMEMIERFCTVSSVFSTETPNHPFPHQSFDGALNELDFDLPDLAKSPKKIPLAAWDQCNDKLSP